MAAMNSYIRQAPIPADQMHSFLKDKQAWENAIAMYQGPDPLDHWYNYVCWYENHGHGDPENKYRETLERCLTLYEHSEYYKQDQRMVRLWIKYIEMQTNPLHYYQVLYHRNVGRQVSAFYIGWAGYYESINALKEAESVYNLGFQEKAQSYVELHHAHSKLLYLLSTTTGTHVSTLHKPLQLQPQQIVHYQQQQPEHVHQQAQVQIQPPQQQEYRQQVSLQQQQPQQQLQIPVQQEQQQVFNQIYQQPTQQIQYDHHPQQQEQQHLESKETVNASANYIHPCGVQISYEPAANVSIEQQLPATAVQAIQHCETAQPKSCCVELTTVGGVKLPRKFAPYCHNNYETWQPALFLEEPIDPCRRCHYVKNLVYPGDGMEYSIEEIRARKFKSHTAILKQQEEPHIVNEYPKQELQEIGTVQDRMHNFDLQPTQLSDTLQPAVQYYTIERNSNIENAAESCNYDDEPEDDEEEYEEEENERLSQHTYQQQQQSVHAIVNTVDDLEEQIEASTIRFSVHSAEQGSQNKTIKIKFKKERQKGNHSVNGGNYGAYTVENIYQQEIASPTSSQDYTARRNGNGFHPYILGQTSTPKTNKTKRSKTKLKRVNKFHTVVCSSSSSSSTENGVTSVHGTANSLNESMIQNASFNDNANYSFSSAVALENSNCSLASAVDRLNFRDQTVVANTSTAVDISTYQENSYFATQHDVEAKERRLQKALETIERHLAKEAIDPFNSELCRAFLTKLDFPGTEDSHANYKIIQTPLPKIANSRTLSLPDGLHFTIDKEVGRGSYGSVYKATGVHTGAVVALKFQKPPNSWEIYICDQVLKRIQAPNILPGLMDISTAIIAPNASLIATEFSPFGSLLDINNKIRQATTKVMHESLVMHFSAQICSIIRHLHLSKIIHADIKPDNFLLMRIPSTDLHFPSLRLIDFGCAIDMTLFPDNEKMKFRKVIQTDGFTCVEMQEGRPWSYETDLFCIAGTVHVMLLGEYMQLQKRAGSWDIKQKLPRYLKKHVWTKFFGEMLNIKASKMPDLNEMRHIFEEETAKMDSELQKQIRTLSNILYRR